MFTASFILLSALAQTPVPPSAPPTDPFAQQDAPPAAPGAPSAQVPAADPALLLPVTHEQRLSQIDNLVRRDQVVEAMSVIQDAIAADSTRFEAYYYAAYVLFKRGMLDEAETQARSALARVPAARRSEVDALLKGMVDKRASDKLVAEADKVLAEGLVAKAAELYTTAWESYPAREDIGLKAASLWAERLSYPERGARILTALVTAPKDPDVALKANQLLASLKAALQKIFDTKTAAAQGFRARGELDAALKAYSEASEALPVRQEPHFERAKIFASRNDFDSVQKELVAMLKLGQVSLDFVQANEFAGLIELPRFMRFARDAFGPAAETAILKRRASVSQERRRAAVTETRTRRTRTIADATAQVTSALKRADPFAVTNTDYRQRELVQDLMLGECRLEVAQQLRGLHRKTSQTVTLVEHRSGPVDLSRVQVPDSLERTDVAGKLEEASPFYGMPPGTYLRVPFLSGVRTVDAKGMDIAPKYLGPAGERPLWLYFPTRAAADAAAEALRRIASACAFSIPATRSNVTGLAIVASADETMAPADQRIYASTVYRGQQQTRLFWELTVDTARDGDKLSTPLSLQVNGPGGIAIQRELPPLQVEAGEGWMYWNTLTPAIPPDWQSGTYRVSLQAGDKVIATTSFELADDAR